MLKLHKPNISILYNSKLKNIKEITGFKESTNEHVDILHGECELFFEERIVIHVYFNKITKYLEGVMINSIKLNDNDTIFESYKRKDKYLNEFYGKPSLKKKNYIYDIEETNWKNEKFEISHFIHDRFGDEEGIYFKIIEEQV